MGVISHLVTQVTVRFTIAMRDRWFRVLEELRAEAEVSRSKLVEAAVAYATLDRGKFIAYAKQFASGALLLPCPSVEV